MMGESKKKLTNEQLKQVTGGNNADCPKGYSGPVSSLGTNPECRACSKKTPAGTVTNGTACHCTVFDEDFVVVAALRYGCFKTIVDTTVMPGGAEKLNDVTISN